MKKKEITLTLKDLIDLGIIKKKKKKKSKNKRSKSKNNKRGYETGGVKTDSSHMQGYSQSMPFSGTSNTGTEIQHLQRQMLEDQIKNPDRFIKNEPHNNLTIDQYKSSITPVLQRIMNLENIGNQLMSDVGYDQTDFINVIGGQQKKEDNNYDIHEDYVRYDDGIDVPSTQDANYFNKEGNLNPYQEIEPHVFSGATLDKKSNNFLFNEPNEKPPETPPLKSNNEIFTPEFETDESLQTPIKEEAPETKLKTPTAKKKYIELEPTDKLVNDKNKASIKFKNLLSQLGKDEDFINNHIQNSDMASLRKTYKYYYEKAERRNKKLENK